MKTADENTAVRIYLIAASMALIAVLFKCNHSGQRQRSTFKTNDKQEEVTGRNHQIHSEESEQKQSEELSAANHLMLAVGPFGSLNQNDQNADIENILDCDHNRTGHIHSAEADCIASVKRKDRIHRE